MAKKTNKKKSGGIGGKAWKSFMSKLYGWGAAIVIVGALFKIEHWEGASEMLIIGLGTEAFIFFMSAFEPPHKDPKWELVYPELADDDAEAGPKNLWTSWTKCCRTSALTILYSPDLEMACAT